MCESWEQFPQIFIPVSKLICVGLYGLTVGGNLWWRGKGIGFAKWMWWVVWTSLFASPQLREQIDWLIGHESKETSHHQLHAVPSDHSLKKQVVVQPNCRHTEHPTQHVLIDVLDVKTHQTKPQNTWESQFCAFMPWCICCQNAGQGLHNDPEATCGFVQMKVQKNLQPFNNQPFNQGVPLLPQEDWPQNREKWNS